MAMYDVTRLYTSIDHTRGLEAVRRRMAETDWSLEAKEFILTLLEVNLTCNYFNNNFYMQVRGTAMGTDVAPVYANICVAD